MQSTLERLLADEKTIEELAAKLFYLMPHDHPSQYNEKGIKVREIIPKWKNQPDNIKEVFREKIRKIND